MTGDNAQRSTFNSQVMGERSAVTRNAAPDIHHVGWRIAPATPVTVCPFLSGANASSSATDTSLATETLTVSRTLSPHAARRKRRAASGSRSTKRTRLACSTFGMPNASSRAGLTTWKKAIDIAHETG